MCVAPCFGQVAHLVDEVARLQGSPLPRTAPSGAPATPPGASLDQLDANSVISAHCLTFRNVQELIEQNRWVLWKSTHRVIWSGLVSFG